EAVRGMAGRRPAVVDALEPAPPDDAPPCSRRVAQMLGEMLAGTRAQLLPELLERLARAGQRIAPEALPAALTATDPVTQALLRPLLGRRGEWLAGHDPAWTWARPDPGRDEEGRIDALRLRWDEGTLEERISILKTVRDLRPAEARAWVQDAL